MIGYQLLLRWFNPNDPRCIPALHDEAEERKVLDAPAGQGLLGLRDVQYTQLTRMEAEGRRVDYDFRCENWRKYYDPRY